MVWADVLSVSLTFFLLVSYSVRIHITATFSFFFYCSVWTKSSFSFFGLSSHIDKSSHVLPYYIFACKYGLITESTVIFVCLLLFSLVFVCAFVCLTNQNIKKKKENCFQGQLLTRFFSPLRALGFFFFLLLFPSWGLDCLRTAFFFFFPLFSSFSLTSFSPLNIPSLLLLL